MNSNNIEITQICEIRINYHGDEEETRRRFEFKSLNNIEKFMKRCFQQITGIKSELEFSEIFNIKDKIDFSNTYLTPTKESPYSFAGVSIHIYPALKIEYFDFKGENIVKFIPINANSIEIDDLNV